MSANAKVMAIVGVGPGLGRALAVRFARGGFAVALVARQDSSLRPVQNEIESFGGTARSYASDATNEQSIGATFARIRQELGAPEVLVYNAGAFKAGGILELSASDFEHAWRVNCLGGLLTAQAVAPGMLERGRGSILFSGGLPVLLSTWAIRHPARGAFRLDRRARAARASGVLRDRRKQELSLCEPDVDHGLVTWLDVRVAAGDVPPDGQRVPAGGAHRRGCSSHAWRSSNICGSPVLRLPSKAILVFFEDLRVREFAKRFEVQVDVLIRTTSVDYLRRIPKASELPRLAARYNSSSPSRVAVAMSLASGRLGPWPEGSADGL
jgi:NAD(P)-dependent dehydrogenase (short-subunit alcohol dehydrogenase family)